MQTPDPDGQDVDVDADADTDGRSDEQSSEQRQQEAYERWWDERLSTFLDTADAIAETCLKEVFGSSAVREDVHVDVLADIEDIDAYHEMLSARRFIADSDGTYDLDWEVETDDGVVTDVFLTCHAEYVDDNRDVITEVDVAIVASAYTNGIERMNQPHVIHRPLSA